MHIINIPIPGLNNVYNLYKTFTNTDQKIIDSDTKDVFFGVQALLLLNGMALMTIWWYSAASAAPMNGPTQKIHWNLKNKNEKSKLV